MATKPAAYEPSPGSVAAGQPPVRKKDRTHWLYIMVIIAVVLGATIGLVFPE
ncbi:MAG: C4-dicarboxylate transporter DctA, partial [Micrococcaceae bacterium]|nr:C4-dicarboxylate transporter DctA [Micrococcaceae bacterium]